MRLRIVHGFKFLQDDLTSKNDHAHVKWEMGKWRKHDGPLEMCKSGFHASEDPYDSLQYVWGPRWFKIEAKGKVLRGSDKFVAEEMRLVKELPTKIAVRFTIACARHTLDNFERKYPQDNRPRKAIEAAETYVKNPTETNQAAAESAVRSAAESAAGSAKSAKSAKSAAWSAKSAARSAAESAAWSARWSVAESSVWSAKSAAELAAESKEVDWQRTTLRRIINEEVATK